MPSAASTGSPACAISTACTDVSLFLSIVQRDLRLALRRRIDWLLPLAFFAVAVSLFPLGVGPERNTLRTIAPGVMWVCALLAAMLSVNQLYATDFTDGSLDQMLLAADSAVVVAAAKALAHWLSTGLPLVIAAPLFGALFGLSMAGLVALVLALLLGTPAVTLLGGLGAALTLGLRNGGVLLILLVLPLAVPTLIFGSAAVVAAESGQSAQAHFSLLGALLIFSALVALPATSAALRIAVE